MGAGFKELVVWQKAMELSKEIYSLSAIFPDNEKYGLTSQVRRSAVSVPSNIAEGQGRLTKGEFRQFLGIARGSLYELETQILLAIAMTYVAEDMAQNALKKLQVVNRMLNGLIKSMDTPTGNTKLETRN
jgi:four helix bundle protein